MTVVDDIAQVIDATDKLIQEKKYALPGIGL